MQQMRCIWDYFAVGTGRKREISPWQGEARRGEAWHGAWRGGARLGKARPGLKLTKKERGTACEQKREHRGFL